jgi:uncharacterized delta-60 repeat protein
MRHRRALARCTAIALLFTQVGITQLVTPSPAWAAGGHLDHSFGGDGRVTTRFSTDVGAEANALVIQSDGKLVAAGDARDRFVAVVRYEADGTLDPSFGQRGRARTRIGRYDAHGTGLGVQSDGKILDGGSSGGAFALTRLRPDGSLDPTFGGDGTVTARVGRGWRNTIYGAGGLVIQPTGKIVIVGNTYRSVALARFEPDGTLDRSFGGDGTITTKVGAGPATASGIAIQPDGKILAVGEVGGKFVVARYRRSGALDTTFGGDGVVTTRFGVGSSGAGSVVIEPNGSIVVSGHADDRFAIVRYTPNGTLDGTFGGDGKVTTAFDARIADASSVTVLGDGSIVAGGSAVVPDPDGGYGQFVEGEFAVARYLADGSPDTGFGGDGSVTTDFGGAIAVGAAVAMQGDGRIVAAGRVGPYHEERFGLARFDPQGTLDPTFGSDGGVTTGITVGLDSGASAVATQGDGRILAVGTAEDPYLYESAALTRYEQDGALDQTFGNAGRVMVQSAAIDAVALQDDGKIVTFGAINGRFVVARYLPDGTLDPAFGHGGFASTAFRFGDLYPGEVAIQDDGKIVIVGSSENVEGEGDSDAALARFDSDGKLDPTFSGNGKVTTESFDGFEPHPTALAIDPHGRILVVATAENESANQFGVARYTPSGTRDSTFGGNGTVLTAFKGSAQPNDVVIQPDGKIVAAGTDWVKPYGSHRPSRFALARYRRNGALDPTFGGDGKVTTAFRSKRVVANGVTIQTNGKIVAAGEAKGRMAVVRYAPNGNLDHTFGGDGKVTTSFGAGPATANGISLQANGKIVVAGQARVARQQRFAVARYLAS